MPTGGEVVKTASEKSSEEPRSGQEAISCPICGTKFYAADSPGFCPVCMLRCAASEEAVVTDAQNPPDDSEFQSKRKTPAALPGPFENYEVLVDNDGKPIELGRGAMG